MDEYVKALEGTKASLNKPSISANERAELLKSIDIFTEKLAEQARHIAWVKSAVFTKERQEAVFQLLKNMLATLQSASAQGPLFTFVPDHYISTLINLTWDLLTHIHPTVPYTSLPSKIYNISLLSLLGLVKSYRLSDILYLVIYFFI